MSHIYRDLPEIPIPPEGRINHHDGQVSIYSMTSGARRRTVIGRAASETTMYANDNFKLKFPELWNQYFGNRVHHQSQIHAGLYALCLGIGLKTGLYPMLQDVFGPKSGNAIMDDAMYSLRTRCGATQLFEVEMSDQLLFSSKCLSDTWFSTFFAEKMPANEIHAFRMKWLEHCAAAGSSSVWLCIDGSNNDCASVKSDKARDGFAKSGGSGHVINYMWAVDAKTGTPVTWFVNHGAMPDCKAIDEMIRFLSASNLSVEGVILDRGFVSQEVLDLITSRGMNYVVMLKSSTWGFTEMMKRHAQEIRWNVRRCVSDDGIFGIVDEVKVFAGSEKTSCIGLYFAGMRSSLRAVELIRKIRENARALRAQIEAGKAELEIPDDVVSYLSLQKEADKIVGLDYNFETWQGAVDAKGYHAIASSDMRSAEEIHELYQLRDVSEKQFSILKSQIDGGVTRVHEDPSIEARLCMGFISSILRTEIEHACEELHLDTNVMIGRADDAYLLFMPNDRYEAIHNLSNRFKKLLEKFDVLESHFDLLAEEVMARKTSPIQSEMHTLPKVEPRRKRGRPVGSKSRKTLEREAEEARLGIQPEDKPKRSPGRPKGSRNKKTLEREALLAQQPAPEETQPKRSPGRPKGSKNKKTLEREARERAEAEKAARGRGRPRGSKNKKTLEREAAERLQQEALKKRGPGRPKGSKNKPKAPSE